MPVNYTTPQWLLPRGGTAAESYAKGFALGEARRRSEQQQQLQQQEMATRAAMAAQERQARAAAAQAELAAEVERQKQLADVAREELRIKKAAQESKDREAALRFAGAAGIERDIASGLSPDQAIMRNAGFFVSDPSAIGSSVNALRPAPSPEVREFPGTEIPPAVQMGNRLQWPPGAGQAPGEELFSVREVKGPGGNVIGQGIVTGPRSGTFREAKPQGMDPIDRSLLNVVVNRLKSNESTLAEEEKKLPMLEKSPRMKAMTQQNIQRLKESIQSDRDQIESMRRPKESVPIASPASPQAGKATAPSAPATPSGVLVRRKSDGKTLLYMGKREDVPTQAFDILN